MTRKTVLLRCLTTAGWASLVLAAKAIRPSGTARIFYHQQPNGKSTQQASAHKNTLTQIHSAWHHRAHGTGRQPEAIPLRTANDRHGGDRSAPPGADDVSSCVTYPGRRRRRPRPAITSTPMSPVTCRWPTGPAAASQRSSFDLNHTSVTSPHSYAGWVGGPQANHQHRSGPSHSYTPNTTAQQVTNPPCWAPFVLLSPRRAGAGRAPVGRASTSRRPFRSCSGRTSRPAPTRSARTSRSTSAAWAAREQNFYNRLVSSMGFERPRRSRPGGVPRRPTARRCRAAAARAPRRRRAARPGRRGSPSGSRATPTPASRRSASRRSTARCPSGSRRCGRSPSWSRRPSPGSRSEPVRGGRARPDPGPHRVPADLVERAPADLRRSLRVGRPRRGVHRGRADRHRDRRADLLPPQDLVDHPDLDAVAVPAGAAR